MVEDGLWQTHAHSPGQSSAVAASFAEADVEVGDTITSVSSIKSCKSVKNGNIILE